MRDTLKAAAGVGLVTLWSVGVSTQGVVMQRNLYFWGPRPFFDKIVLQNQREAATQRLLVQRGSVDVAMDIDIQQAQASVHRVRSGVHRRPSALAGHSPERPQLPRVIAGLDLLLRACARAHPHRGNPSG